MHAKRKKPKVEVETYKGKELGAPQEFDEVSIDTEDGGFILLEFDNGVRGNLVVSQVSAGRKNRRRASARLGVREEPCEHRVGRERLRQRDGRPFLQGRPEGRPWTDDFSNILQAIRWK